MIIKSHIRGGYRSAAEYLKEQGKNEYTRVVELSDPSAKNLDDAFRNMWVVASNTRCTKPLHHISINPMKDERLTDKQVLAIVQRCEEKYGYKMFHHQRVIVEHIKDGRQHFHVIWNRVSLMTGRPVWPGHHWKKSKQVCREMEKELGLKRPLARMVKRPFMSRGHKESLSRNSLIRTPNYYRVLKVCRRPFTRPDLPPKPSRNAHIQTWWRRNWRKRKDENEFVKLHLRDAESERAELIHWAFENGRLDILAYCGIHLSQDYFEP